MNILILFSLQYIVCGLVVGKDIEKIRNHGSSVIKALFPNNRIIKRYSELNLNYNKIAVPDKNNTSNTASKTNEGKNSTYDLDDRYLPDDVVMNSFISMTKDNRNTSGIESPPSDVPALLSLRVNGPSKFNFQSNNQNHGSKMSPRHIHEANVTVVGHNHTDEESPNKELAMSVQEIFGNNGSNAARNLGVRLTKRGIISGYFAVDTVLHKYTNLREKNNITLYQSVTNSLTMISETDYDKRISTSLSTPLNPTGIPGTSSRRFLPKSQLNNTRLKNNTKAEPIKTNLRKKKQNHVSEILPRHINKANVTVVGHNYTDEENAKKELAMRVKEIFGNKGNNTANDITASLGRSGYSPMDIILLNYMNMNANNNKQQNQNVTTFLNTTSDTNNDKQIPKNLSLSASLLASENSSISRNLTTPLNQTEIPETISNIFIPKSHLNNTRTKNNTEAESNENNFQSNDQNQMPEVLPRNIHDADETVVGRNYTDEEISKEELAMRVFEIFGNKDNNSASGIDTSRIKTEINHDYYDYDTILIKNTTLNDNDDEQSYQDETNSSTTILETDNAQQISTNLSKSVNLSASENSSVSRNEPPILTVVPILYPTKFLTEKPLKLIPAVDTALQVKVTSGIQSIQRILIKYEKLKNDNNDEQPYPDVTDSSNTALDTNSDNQNATIISVSPSLSASENSSVSTNSSAPANLTESSRMFSTTIISKSLLTNTQTKNNTEAVKSKIISIWLITFLLYFL